MTIAYTLEMQGPEWTEVLGVFSGTVDGVLPQARAAALKHKLEQRDPVAMRRVPRTYRDDVFMRLSTFHIVGRTIE